LHRNPNNLPEFVRQGLGKVSPLDWQQVTGKPQLLRLFESPATAANNFSYSFRSLRSLHLNQRLGGLFSQVVLSVLQVLERVYCDED
jgi:hypothetical protein